MLLCDNLYDPNLNIPVLIMKLMLIHVTALYHRNNITISHNMLHLDVLSLIN
jgi:hypothetical protein